MLQLKKLTSLSFFAKFIGMAFLTFLAVVAAEEFYRSRIFVPALQHAFLDSLDVRKTTREFETNSSMVASYFVADTTLRTCLGRSEGCFDWSDFPNAESIVITTAGILDEQAVLLSRHCPSGRNCTYLEDWNSFAIPLNVQQFSDVLDMEDASVDCFEVDIASLGKFLPIQYQTVFCRKFSYVGEEIVSAGFNARVSQPYYAQHLASIWFRNELSIFLSFVKKTYEIDQRWSEYELIKE